MNDKLDQLARMQYGRKRPPFVDPKTVLLITPTHDGNVCAGYCGGAISSAGLYGGISFIVGNSDVRLARNVQAHAFLKTGMTWLLSVDADIEFSRRDLELLSDHSDESLVRVAEYAKKTFKPGPPAQLAMGFTLIHRSVFETLDTVEWPSQEGQPAITQFFFEGELVRDYFMSGPDPAAHWVSEDRGFFTYCKLANIVPRGETRTRLIHWGRHGFQYVPPTSNELGGELPQEK